MRIAFFGSSQFSVFVLEALLASGQHTLTVISQPDQPAGRRMQLRPTPLAEFALSAGLQVLRPRRLRGNDELVKQLQAGAIEALALASYGKLVPASLLELTPWPLNVHPSPLPLLRGPSPLRSALLAGWSETAVCIMRMTERLDDGPLLMCRLLPIPCDQNYAALERSAGELGGTTLLEVLELIKSGAAHPLEQDHSRASYTKVFSRSDSRIDWRQPAIHIVNAVRAWDPDIGAWGWLRSKAKWRRLKIWRAMIAQDTLASTLQPGELLQQGKQRLFCGTASAAVELLEVQPENGRRMTASSFVAGGHVTSGDRFALDETEVVS